MQGDLSSATCFDRDAKEMVADGLTSPRLPLDVAAVAAYLAKECCIPAPVWTSVRQFSAGQSNPTYLLEGGPQAAAFSKVVLRRQPPGDLLPSAHDVRREHRVLKALARTPVPVPNVLALCTDSEVLGVDWMVMEYVAGVAPDDERLPGFTAESRSTAWASAIAVLAALHSVDHIEVGLSAHGRPGGGYVKRQLNAWSRTFGMVEAWLQERQEQLDDAAADANAESPPLGAQARAMLVKVLAAGSEMATLEEQLRAGLAENVGAPADEPTCIVHGDYRLGNLLLHPQSGSVMAVLDWELSTLGHPLCDVAYFLSAHGAPSELGGFGGMALPPGTPSEAVALQLYCEQAGVPVPPPSTWAFFCAHAWHRRAAICHGVFARALQGNASAPDALRLGALGFCECVRLGLEAMARGAAALQSADAPRSKL